jgi:carboxymethylenebutenolidase
MARFALVFTILLGFASPSHLLAAEGLAPSDKEAKARIEKSPRHGEYVDIKVEGRDKPVKSFVVYPEVKDKAPVVIVIHEIFGLTDWVKGVADQLAADGFIAIAPDLLSGKGAKGGGTEDFDGEKVREAVRSITPEESTAALNAVRDYGMKLPASNGKTATVGYCWGGAKSFEYATKQPGLSAAVVYYGTSPSEADLKNLNVPVLGLYGSDDARVNKTIEPAQKVIKEAGKHYTPHIYEGAGHGFLRQQDGKDGANLKATQQAWPETVKFIREHTK